uniref:CDIP transferase, opposite strand n=2 Tax=Mus musculus TaxID=10090 RepID=A0A1D5RL94_MOUSE
MASTSARSGDKKDIRSSQAAASLGGGQKLSCSEEFLTRISTELTDEALFIARSRLSPLPNKEKNTKDQGTQISRHALTKIEPEPRHTFCHLLVKRDHSPTA